MSEYYFVVRYLKIAFGGIKVTFGCVFKQAPYFWVFRSCGEVEALDGVFVVAGEVVLAAAAFLVVVHVVVEVAVDDDGVELGLPPRRRRGTTSRL